MATVTVAGPGPNSRAEVMKNVSVIERSRVDARDAEREASGHQRERAEQHPLHGVRR